MEIQNCSEAKSSIRDTCMGGKLSIQLFLLLEISSNFLLYAWDNKSKETTQRYSLIPPLFYPKQRINKSFAYAYILKLAMTKKWF